MTLVEPRTVFVPKPAGIAHPACREITIAWRPNAMTACPTYMSGALAPDIMQPSSPWFPTKQSLLQPTSRGSLESRVSAM